MYVNLKSEERISVPRFLNLLPQKCSQHIDELAVGRWFGKCSSRNMFQEAPIRLLPAAPDKRSQIPLNRGRRNAKFPGCFPIEPFGNEPDALWVLSDLFHHIGSTGKSMFCEAALFWLPGSAAGALHPSASASLRCPVLVCNRQRALIPSFLN